MKKLYATPQVTDFGALADVVLNQHDTGSGDSATAHNGGDSGYVD